MGSYDGAETCELVGLYMLSLITPKFKGQVGLYRDDGLAVCKATPKQIEKIKQEVCDIFKSNGLKITIEANKKTINFLDVTLDLTSGSYKPFMKPNNKILYVHRHSNHPPALLKNIPENINKRLTSISSNQKVFDEAIPPYQKALDESGYNHKLTYNPQPKRNRNRQRKIVWYNPPWDANVKTNLGRKFLNIIDRCFPSGHPLHKIFNKHTLKLSYSCMPNMKSIISSHNKAVLSDYHQSQTTQTCNKECNCRKKDQCPLDGKCLSQNVVYQATVTTQTSSESYVGLASNFKDRYRNHTASFRHESKRNETELSKHVWTLQDTNKPFSIKWRIIKQCRPYNNVNNKCGWTLISRFRMNDANSLQDASLNSNSYREILPNYNSNNQYLLRNGFNQFKNDTGFTQMRFYCFKKETGRVFHIMTNKNSSGANVAKFFTVSDTMPEACGSFTRLPDDNSTLAINCDSWGYPNTNRWGHISNLNDKRLYTRPFLWASKLYYTLLSKSARSCDDNLKENAISLGDTWQIFVR
ncbi:hypothetical protein ACROYT_G001617 [Oculina patagonica]